MQTSIIITNAHEHGFAFGYHPKSNEQVFIPVHAAAGHNISAGDTINATLVPNFSDKSRDGTAWRAVKLHSDKEVAKPASVTSTEPTEFNTVHVREQLDEHVLEFVSACSYATTSEIASACNVDQKTAGNAAQRHYNGGRIARAEVYHRTGQSRPSFVLYASDAQNFLEDEQ